MEPPKFDPKKIKKIKFAPAPHVEQYRSNVDKLILLIAPIMGFPEGDKAEDFLRYTFISDQSTLGDFLTDPNELTALGEKLGFIPHTGDYIYEIAARMGKPQ